MNTVLLYAVWPDHFQRIAGVDVEEDGHMTEAARESLLATGAPFWRAFKVNDNEPLDKVIPLVEKYIRLTKAPEEAQPSTNGGVE